MAQRRFSISTLLIAIFGAVALWTYVSLTRTYEDDLDVPLVVISPPNQAMLSTVPSTVRIRIRATGLQILNALYFTKSVACTLDLASMQSDQPSTYIAEISDLLSGVTTTIPMRTLSVQPERITLTTGDLAVKRVPLRVTYSLACRPGFMLTAEPRTDVINVEVRGSRNVVEGLTHWSTEPIFLDDVHETRVVDVPVSDSLQSLINIQPSRVRVTFSVQQAADRTIADVPVGFGVAVDSLLTLSPRRISVVIRGGVEDIASITARDLRAEISELSPSGIVRPRVIAPPSVTVISTSPAFVRVR
jgi:YbbR domain-containing protein